jgi:hypothetical protein
VGALNRVELCGSVDDTSSRPDVQVIMEERRRLQQDLERYRALLRLIADPQVIAGIEQLMRETLDRLAALDRERQDAATSRNPNSGRGLKP